MNLQSQSDTKNLFPTLPGYSQENLSGAWTPPPGPYLLSEVIEIKVQHPLTQGLDTTFRSKMIHHKFICCCVVERKPPANTSDSGRRLENSSVRSETTHTLPHDQIAAEADTSHR